MTQKQLNLKRAIESALMNYLQFMPEVVDVKDADISFSNLADNKGEHIDYDALENCCQGDYSGTIRVSVLDDDLKVPLSKVLRKSGSFRIDLMTSEKQLINVTIISCY